MVWWLETKARSGWEAHNREISHLSVNEYCSSVDAQCRTCLVVTYIWEINLSNMKERKHSSKCLNCPIPVLDFLSTNGQEGVSSFWKANVLESSLGAGQDARYFWGKLGASGYTRIHVGKPWSIFENIYLGEWHGGQSKQWALRLVLHIWRVGSYTGSAVNLRGGG